MKRRRSLSFVAILVLFVIYHTPIHLYAQYLSGSVVDSTGGAGRGAAEPIEALLLNPAALVHSPDFSGAVIFRDGALTPISDVTQLALGMIDNNPDAYFTGGFLYGRSSRHFSAMPSVDEVYWHATGADFIAPNLALGVSAVRLEQKSSGQKFEQWDGAVGMHYTPSPNLGLGLVYSYFVAADKNVPEYLELLPEIGFGINYLATAMMRFRADGVYVTKNNPEKRWNWHLGTELYTNEYVVLRFGVARDGIFEDTRWTAGASLNGPRFKLDYSYSKYSGADQAMHGVDLRFPF